ncbi:MAG: hypothetical protein O2967_08855 [Proteobacteria bacterium]|nr:hypothetical protein [Pseudomonadota bacterium]
MIGLKPNRDSLLRSSRTSGCLVPSEYPSDMIAIASGRLGDPMNIAIGIDGADIKNALRYFAEAGPSIPKKKKPQKTAASFWSE